MTTSNTKTYLKNKIILGCLFSLSATAGTMGPMQNDPHNIFSGVYVGAMGGIDQFNQKTTFSRVTTYPLIYSSNSMLSVSQTNRNYKNNTVGAIYLGYGRFIKNSLFYLAAEVFADFSNHKTSIKNTAYDQNNSSNGSPVFQNTASLNTKTTMKLNNAEVALDLKPGYLFDESTLIYGRIGVAFNKTTLNTQDIFTFTSIPTPAAGVSSLSSQNKSSNKSSIRLGVGIERSLSKHFSLTADYIYTGYGRVTTNSTAPTFGQDYNGYAVENPSGLAKYTSSILNTNTVMIGVKRYFS